MLKFGFKKDISTLTTRFPFFIFTQEIPCVQSNFITLYTCPNIKLERINTH